MANMDEFLKSAYLGFILTKSRNTVSKFLTKWIVRTKVANRDFLHSGYLLQVTGTNLNALITARKKSIREGEIPKNGRYNLQIMLS